MKVLIIGVGGTGKTYTVQKLREKGINAFDADSIPGLSYFADDEGNKVAFPLNADREWWSRNHFRWDINRLKEFLQPNGPLYLFGISENAFDVRNLFNKTYYLTGNKELIKSRLQSENRNNPMGKIKEQRALILESLEENNKKAKKLGIPLIDVAKSPEEIFSIIK